MAGFKKYFEDNAKQWILDGYNESGYNYPTAFHRVRIVSKFISNLNKKRLEIIDLGCGGGDLAFCLAQDGYKVTGIDQSQKMIDVAEKRRLESSKNIQSRVRFLRGAVEKMNLGKKFDVVTAMGFIGYLPNDKILFDVANKLLKPNGYLLISCRNRLFNMKSISFRTKKEIKNKEAIKLIDELGSLYNRIPAKEAEMFIKKLKKITEDLPKKTSFDKKLMLPPSEKYGSYASALKSQARQSTPKQLKKTASKCGFKYKAYYGIHPHLMDPNLNKMLPPQIFNKISGCLEALEHLPISLTWSSVFIGAFQKILNKKRYGKR